MRAMQLRTGSHPRLTLNQRAVQRHKRVSAALLAKLKKEKTLANERRLQHKQRQPKVGALEGYPCLAATTFWQPPLSGNTFYEPVNEPVRDTPASSNAKADALHKLDNDTQTHAVHAVGS